VNNNVIQLIPAGAAITAIFTDYPNVEIKFCTSSHITIFMYFILTGCRL